MLEIARRREMHSSSSVVPYLSMRALYLFMEAYECDANTLLNLDTNKEVSLDAKLMKLPKEKRDYFMRSFSFMIDGMSGMQVVGR